jgi:hypothetical protein
MTNDSPINKALILLHMDFPTIPLEKLKEKAAETLKELYDEGVLNGKMAAVK